MRQTELKLSPQDRATVEAVRGKGVHHSREVNRAHVLACLDKAARVKTVVASFMQPSAVYLMLANASGRLSRVRG